MKSCRFLLLSLGFILVACASEIWVKPGATEEQKDADLRACERFAHAQVRKEERANPPSVSGNADASGGSQSETSTSLTLNLERYHSGRRYDELLKQCMTENGYIQK